MFPRYSQQHAKSRSFDSIFDEKGARLITDAPDLTTFKLMAPSTNTLSTLLPYGLDFFYCHLSIYSTILANFKEDQPY